MSLKQFELTMMCTSCKWKITEELKKQGYTNFNINMDTSILTFNDHVDAYRIMMIVSKIGYKIEMIEEKLVFTDEELLMLADEMRNQNF